MSVDHLVHDGIDDKGNTVLHQAIHELDECKILQITDNLSKNRCFTINTRNIYGQTPLHLAAVTCSLTVLERLIDSGADLDMKTNLEETPLHLSVLEGSAAIVKLLLEKGANPEIPDREGNSLLHLALKRSDHEEELEQCIHDDSKALYTARQQLQKLDILMNFVGDVNLKNNYGDTPLHIAAEYCSVLVVEKLIVSGADINMQNYIGETPLHLSVEGGNAPNVKLLLEKGANPKLKERHGDIPLHVAVRLDDKEGLEYNDCTESKALPVVGQHLETFNILMNYIENVNVKNNKGDTPLHIAAHYDGDYYVQELLHHDADPSIRNNFNLTPYQLALRSNGLLSQFILFEHYTKLQILNLPVDLGDVDLSKEVDHAIGVRCGMELEKIDKINVHKYIPLKIIFRKYNRPYFFRDEVVMRSFEETIMNPENLKRFYFYGHIMKNLFVKVKNHLQLLDRAYDSICSESRQAPLRNLPVIVKEQILGYLNIEELEILISSDGYWTD